MTNINNFPRFKNHILLVFVAICINFFSYGQDQSVWEIGLSDNSAQGMALYPNSYRDFVKMDFGFEDNFFLLGHHEVKNFWPYIIPGPKDTWGGTWSTSGIRSHILKIDFELTDMDEPIVFDLLIDILDTDSIHPAKLKVSINKKAYNFFLKKGIGQALLSGSAGSDQEQLISIPIPKDLIKNGFNEIEITILEGAWIAFDQIKLSASEHVSLRNSSDILLKSNGAADYEIQIEENQFQPLLIELIHLRSEPNLKVLLDDKDIFNKIILEGTYNLEVPMPSVTESKTSLYKIYINGELLQKGNIKRSPQKLIQPEGYVNTLMGTGHSRWMIAPGPWMPFGMVKISPDNQNAGWQAGYDPTFESIGTFSHIHEWTMGGLGTFPTNGELQIKIGDQYDPDSGYRSRIDKNSEEAPLGIYKVHLTDTDIIAEMTATTRASFQKYTYNKGGDGRIMIDLSIPAEYTYQIQNAEIKKISDYRLEGYSHQLTPNTWAGGIDQEYTIYFVMEFDQPISGYGSWINDKITKNKGLNINKEELAGMYVEFNTLKNKTVQLRTGISYVSIENAALNLKKEITDVHDWDFESVVAENKSAWNKLLSRILVFSDDRREKERFYTNMYRALASRNIFSDVDGSWRDADENIRKFQKPEDLALGCDAFWNTFWNLNQFWNLATPEWSGKWVRSQLAMYDANGWLAKGPAGMEYIPVMVAEHEIPLIVGAYQMGIRDYDVAKAFEAVYKMQTTPATKVGGGLAGNIDLEDYLEHNYVPYDKGRFSNSLEYSFDDYSVSQFAKALDKNKEYLEFKERGTWWKNVIDPETGFARMKDSNGNWLEDFDPFKSGANHHYVEGNAWQLTFFVPQDIPGLVEIIGENNFVNRLDWGFEQSYPWRFNGINDQYWDYPVAQGNQQSMHFAFLFNWAKRPWLTQKWSRAIMERYYGYGISNAYLGDEDQGQMSAWFVMNSIGLFQMDGGVRMHPIYEIGSPIFEEIKIDLAGLYGRGKSFTIKAINSNRKNIYVQSATLNGKQLNNFWFPASELLKGGNLIFMMGDNPNKEWGIEKMPPSAN